MLFSDFLKEKEKEKKVNYILGTILTKLLGRLSLKIICTAHISYGRTAYETLFSHIYKKSYLSSNSMCPHFLSKVLQRKTEEAAMATKRLKEILEARKSSARDNSGIFSCIAK
jgi:hypothetical protein